MPTQSPVLTLNNGVKMPALGLGVYQSPPEQTVAAVEAALATGYRLIDTAAAYLNEREVGEGIRRSGEIPSRNRFGEGFGINQRIDLDGFLVRRVAVVAGTDRVASQINGNLRHGFKCLVLVLHGRMSLTNGISLPANQRMVFPLTYPSFEFRV